MACSSGKLFGRRGRKEMQVTKLYLVPREQVVLKGFVTIVELLVDKFFMCFINYHIHVT